MVNKIENWNIEYYIDYTYLDLCKYVEINFVIYLFLILLNALKRKKIVKIKDFEHNQCDSGQIYINNLNFHVTYLWDRNRKKIQTEIS